MSYIFILVVERPGRWARYIVEDIDNWVFEYKHKIYN